MDEALGASMCFPRNGKPRDAVSAAELSFLAAGISWQPLAVYRFLYQHFRASGTRTQGPGNAGLVSVTGSQRLLAGRPWASANQ